MPARNNRILVKDRVGQGRVRTYAVPSDADGDFRYGKVPKADSEGAGAVLSTWQGAQLSKAAARDHSFVESNRRAIKSKAVTARDFRAYTKTHGTIRPRAPRVGGQVPQTDPSLPWNGSQVFGASSTRSAVGVKNLIEGENTRWDEDDKFYPNVAERVVHRLPEPRATRASKGMDVRKVGCSDAIVSTQAAQRFKMAKFKDIPSRV
eukprot:g1288.t1